MAARKLTTTPDSVQRITPNLPRAFGYCRVSTDMQADSGISLDEQQRKIEGRCLENGWSLERIFVDAGVSGSTPLAHRPEGAKWLAAVRPGDVVVSARMDRCFRSAFDALETIKSFKKRHISPWLLDLGDVSGNGVSELIMTVLAAVAQFERTLISERIKDAKRNLRRAGKDQGGRRPFGFQLGEVNGHGKARELVPDPDEQEAIRVMRSVRDEGLALRPIAARMRELGYQIGIETTGQVLRRQEGAP